MRVKPTSPNRRDSFTSTARAALLFASGFLTVVVPLDVIERHGGVRHLNEVQPGPCNIAPRIEPKPAKAPVPPAQGSPESTAPAAPVTSPPPRATAERGPAPARSDAKRSTVPARTAAQHLLVAEKR